ncbi:heterokaryon incompatibility protein-domain-containing protein [Aspergillus bertholletiae]|uniref:Heterokaryon incompatibility protein-domain-containing protein n=1 Tax=Aspergillus bertholletiae TaxID=1226010 RepID=A0A5N7APM2_9EURO|nr:heterokaryon incompatibility protein-domain-containing protein [Aspergillus bertholletiae]
MWLLNARTVTLEEFFENEAPPYSILSHTWGREEVSFQEIQDSQKNYTKKKGYQKILHTCRQALNDGLKYAWVDTCCIDKSSSSELSEAINSMFRWYGKAAICYAFLVDVPPGCNTHDPKGPFSKSRWFTRGWTLQELFGPRKIELNLITGIDTRFFTGRTSSDGSISAQSRSGTHMSYMNDGTLQRRSTPILHQASIAERMRIFGISMPLIYGEGERAFARLQEEIIKTSQDQSILAWGHLAPWRGPKQNIERGFKQDLSLFSDRMSGEQRPVGILARSPTAFRDCGSIVPSLGDKHDSFHLSVTNKGLHICPPVSHNELFNSKPSQQKLQLALLQCRPRDNPTLLLAIVIKYVHGNTYCRLENRVHWINYRTWFWWSKKAIYLSLEEHLEEEFYQNSFSFSGSSIYIRQIPDTFSVQELSPHAQSLTSNIFPPNHKTITPGLSPCEGNIALLLSSEEKRSKVVLYLSLTELPTLGSSPLMMRKETFLISVPYRCSISEACSYLPTSTCASGYVWWGDAYTRSWLNSVSKLWEALDFLFNQRKFVLILLWLAYDAVLHLMITSIEIKRGGVITSKFQWRRSVMSQVLAISTISVIAFTVFVKPEGYFINIKLLYLAYLYCLPLSFIAKIVSLLLGSLQNALPDIGWIFVLLCVIVFAYAFLLFYWEEQGRFFHSELKLRSLVLPPVYSTDIFNPPKCTVSISNCKYIAMTLGRMVDMIKPGWQEEQLLTWIQFFEFHHYPTSKTA